MKEKKNRAWIPLIISAALTLLFTVVVMTVDVAPIGPEQSRVGLSHLNAAARDVIGYHPFWYTVTKIIGALAFLVVGAFALTGFIQLVRKKNFFKVDAWIRFLGMIYVITFAIYLFFEIVIINYRPMILSEAEGLEASYPSSHTMMACVIFGTAIPCLARVTANRALRITLTVLCIALMCVMVVGRCICGVHWITDIIASLFFSVTLIFLYAFLRQFR